jgi:uncharacterized membrane protein YuzA (DUF378 family)
VRHLRQSLQGRKGERNGYPGIVVSAAIERDTIVRTLNLITLLLIIIGGVNWLLVGLFGVDLVASIFGPRSVLANLVYIVVGLSALYQLVPFSAAINRGEVDAEAHPNRVGR